MGNSEWFGTFDPDVMLVELQESFSSRKLRLACCACMRRIWDQIDDSKASCKAVEAAEDFADGLLSQHELSLAATESQRVTRRAPNAERKSARKAAVWCASTVIEPLSIGRSVTWGAAYARGKSQEAERLAQVQLLHDVFDNLFLPDLSGMKDMSWINNIVIQVAQHAYQERRLPSGVLDNSRLAVLADAMEEGGCNTTAILAHCRSAGPHVRRCWVVDLILGKR